MKTIQLKSTIEVPKISLEQLMETPLSHYEYIIDCSKLSKPDYNQLSLDYAGELLPMIHEIMKIDKPCLYWFELENTANAKKIISEYEYFKKSNPSISLPPINHNKIKNHLGNCIYVGVRQGGMRKKDSFSNIAGRLAIHFGYYKVKTTQGVNFAYWCKEKIKVNVIELPETASVYLNLIEKLMSNNLKPLFGKY